MKQIAYYYVYWYNINKDIERTVKACPGCAVNQVSLSKALINFWEELYYDCQRVHTNYTGSLFNYYFLVGLYAKSK